MSFLKAVDDFDNSKEHPLAILINSTDILTHKNQDEIYEQSNNFNNEIKDFVISSTKYDISFMDNKMILKQTNSNSIYSFEILKNPIKITFGSKSINLYRKETLIYIAENLNEQYKLIQIDSGNTAEGLSYEIKAKKYEINGDLKKIYIEYNDNYNFDNYNKNSKLSINPKILTPNFFSIFKRNIKEENFTIYLNETRNTLISSINNFIKSKEKRYYWLLGSDGIGKSVTLLFITILNHESYKFLYFNTKLFSENENENFKNIFFNELYKCFFLNCGNNLDTQICLFNKLIEKLDSEKIDDNVKNYQKFWHFLKVLISSIFFPVVIIIDQYKNDQFDNEYKQINSFIEEIEKKKIRLQYGIKVILSSSINNTDRKQSFITNLNSIIGNYENNNFIDEYSNNPKFIKNILDKNQKAQNNNQENEENENYFKIFEEKYDTNKVYKEACEYFQYLLLESEKKYREDYISLILIKKNNLDSNFILNNTYSSITLKEYISSLISGKELVKELKLSKKEENMIEEFEYNLKYIYEYIYLKHNIKIQKKDITEDNLIDESIDSYYYLKLKHIISKINSYYLDIFAQKEFTEINSPTYIPYNKLCQLRSYIIKKKTFSINELINAIKDYPMKYLNVSLLLYDNNQKYFEFNNMVLFSKFKLEYSSNIARTAFNCLLSNIENTITNNKLNELEGSSEGWYLESRVNKIFKNNFFFKFKKEQFEVRYLFSLAGITNNSEKTIYQHRKDSKNLMDFLIGKNNYNVIIDDIDHNFGEIKLDKKYYYFQQISQTGRSFDMAFIQKNDTNEDYNLYLFQCKINVDELKNKSFYIFEGKEVKKNLKNIYNINIDTIYLTLVISDYNKKDEIINKIITKDLNYISFNYDDNIFYDKNNIVVKSLDLKDSLLDLKINNSFYGEIISNEEFYDLFIKSSKIFLKNKKSSFYKIFIKNLINKLSNSYKEQKELIISKDLHNNIIKHLNLDVNAKFIFFRNCFRENLIYINTKYNGIIFFKFNQQWYFYYKSYYKFTNSFLIESVQKKEEEEDILRYINKDQNEIIDLEEAEKKQKNKSKYAKLVKGKKSELNIDILNKNIKININDLNKIKNSPDFYAFLIIEPALIWNILYKIFE